MKILVLGHKGMLGTDLVTTLGGVHDVIGKDVEDFDIVSASDCRDLVEESGADVIINAAAYTNVDGCETEKELSWNVNVKALEYLAYFSRVFHFHLVHISTDYVFNGKTGLYKEDDKPEPLSHYGKEKLASENAVLQHAEKYSILRTNVLFGVAYGNNLNFIT